MTRAQRLQTSLRTGEHGILQGVTETVVPSHFENEPTFFNSLPVGNSELDTSGFDDARYSSAGNDGDCTD